MPDEIKQYTVATVNVSARTDGTVPPDIEVRVSQKPVSVELECPECYHEASWPYDEFKKLYGDSADWTGSRIECPNCHRQYTIGNQTWD